MSTVDQIGRLLSTRLMIGLCQCLCMSKTSFLPEVLPFR